MAKKGARATALLVCTVCKSQNYLANRNKVNTPEKMEYEKYCRRCKKHTTHKESSKLK